MAWLAMLWFSVGMIVGVGAAVKVFFASDPFKRTGALAWLLWSTGFTLAQARRMVDGWLVEHYERISLQHENKDD